MFLTPINKIDFQKVEDFCRKYPEGARVEYKSRLANVSKSVSSLANTGGGIVIFGVEIDKKTNLPLSEIPGIENTEGLEETVTQACIQGGYPPITPDVKIVSIPSSSKNVVVVVKVTESLDAPHAIENSTKVFMRVNSTTEPVKLADIDRIEWLLSRRRNSESRREEIVETALRKFQWNPIPRMAVIIGPLYPHGNILTRDGLESKIDILKTNHKLSYLVDCFRKSQGGYISAKPPSSRMGDYYAAINFYGFFILVENIFVKNWGEESSEYRMIDLVTVVKKVAEFVKAAIIVLDQSESFSLFLRVRLEYVGGLAIHTGRDYLRIADWYEDHKVVFNDVVEGEEVIALGNLNEQFPEVIKALVRQLMWAFNWHDDMVDERTEDILKANYFL